MKHNIGIIFFNDGFFANHSISSKAWNLTPYISDYFYIKLSHIPDVNERFVFRTLSNSLIYTTVRDKMSLPQITGSFYDDFIFYRNDTELYLFFETIKRLKIDKSVYQQVESKIINL